MPLTHESEGKNFKTNGQESIYITREREGLIKL
jgi:hypothetical protein